jgi:xanthine dehydrogenase small subunit
MRLLHAGLRDVAVGPVPQADKDGITPDKREIDDALSGNLCRCTGYRPIIDAARRMGELPKVEFDREAVKAALRAIDQDTPLAVTHAGQTFHAPRTLAQLVQLRADLPKARIWPAPPTWACG